MFQVAQMMTNAINYIMSDRNIKLMLRPNRQFMTEEACAIPGKYLGGADVFCSFPALSGNVEAAPVRALPHALACRIA